tara:strand:+ start:16740 stop:17345 length:606 start_codon:yes stop_codon:yes gene_type:complete
LLLTETLPCYGKIMISSLQGKILFKEINFIVLDVNGIGYKVFLSEKTLHRIAKEQVFLKLFTFLHVKEDALALYGFLSKEELDLFETLYGISGIGPKAALSLSAIGSVEEFKKTIDKDGFKVFEAVKGIGRKKIQKIVLELTGKLTKLEKKEPLSEDPAVDALVSLGFSRQKSREVLKEVLPKIKDSEQRVKEALKILGKG